VILKRKKNFKAIMAVLLLIVSIVAFTVIYRLWKARGECVQPLRIQSIHIYPVKSCQGISVSVANVESTGLQYDRLYCVALVVPPKRQDHNGGFKYQVMTQRERPKLATISTSIVEREIDGTREPFLQLDAPNQSGSLFVPLAPTEKNKEGPWEKIRLWRSVGLARSVGDDASRWLTDVIRHPKDRPKQKLDSHVANETQPRDKHGATYVLLRISKNHERQCIEDPKWGFCALPEERIAFADMSPLLITCQASLDFLNTKLKVPVSMTRFRSNIVLAGGTAWQEDNWSMLEVDLGSDVDHPSMQQNSSSEITQRKNACLYDKLLIRVMKSCHRCIVPTIDQGTGAHMQEYEPLKTLRSFRLASHVGKNEREVFLFGNSPLFGVNASPLAVSIGTLSIPFEDFSNQQILRNTSTAEHSHVKGIQIRIGQAVKPIFR